MEPSVLEMVAGIVNFVYLVLFHLSLVLQLVLCALRARTQRSQAQYNAVIAQPGVTVHSLDPRLRALVYCVLQVIIPETVLQVVSDVHQDTLLLNPVPLNAQYAQMALSAHPILWVATFALLAMFLAPQARIVYRVAQGHLQDMTPPIAAYVVLELTALPIPLHALYVELVVSLGQAHLLANHVHQDIIPHRMAQQIAACVVLELTALPIPLHA